MWIVTTLTDDNGDPLLRRIDREELSKPVEFADTGKAQVSEADAQYLFEHGHPVEPVDTADSEDTTDDEPTEPT